MTQLRLVAPGLWTLAEPLSAIGVPMGRRMSVVRLGDGGLWIHSPAPLGEELREQLEAIGPVTDVVAPSNIHGHLSLAEYGEGFPSARVWGAPGLPKRRRDLRLTSVVGQGDEPPWAGEIPFASFEGHRFVTELEFLHPPSRTLIAADLCFNLGGAWPLRSRLFANGPRLRRRLGPTLLFRAGIRDKRAAANSIKRILDWDFDRILVGHGEDVEAGGHDAFERAFAWLHT